MHFDFHRHLEGSHSPRALEEVARRYQIAALRDPVTQQLWTAAQMQEKAVMQGPGVWDDFYARIKFSRQAYVSSDAIRDLTRIACVEAAQESDKFEFRFSLFSMTKTFLANTGQMLDAIDDTVFADVHARMVLDAILAGRDEAVTQTGKPCLLRFGLSRTFERPNKYKTMCDMAEEYADKLVGLDVLGSAETGPKEALPSQLVEMLNKLRQRIPDLSMHAGELQDYGAVENALQLEPNGIGHGVRAVENADLLHRLAHLNTTLEVCPSSNHLLITGTIDQLTAMHGAHPLKVLLGSGIKCVLSTDDPTIFGTTLEREWEKAQQIGVDLEAIEQHAAKRWTELTGGNPGE